MNDESAHDRGQTGELQVWLRQRWREWRHLTGAEPPHSDAERDLFDAWLDARRANETAP